MKFEENVIIKSAQCIPTARNILERAKYGDRLDPHELIDRIGREKRFTQGTIKRAHQRMKECGFAEGDEVLFTPQVATSLGVSIYQSEAYGDWVRPVRCALAIVNYLSEETALLVQELSPLALLVERLEEVIPKSYPRYDDLATRIRKIRKEARDRLNESIRNITEQLQEAQP